MAQCVMSRRYRNKSASEDVISKSSSTDNGAADEESRFQQILNKLEENKQSSDNQFRHLMAEIQKVSLRMDTLEKEQTQIVNALDFVSKDVEDVQNKIKELETAVETLQKANATSIQNTETAMESLENEKNKKALIVANIPISHNENLPKIIVTLASRLNCNIKESDIDAVFRIKSVKPANPPLIMVKFHQLAVRDRLYDARKLFIKNAVDTTSLQFTQKQRIYINEALSKAQQRLFQKTRQKKSELGWKYAWTFHGQVFLRQSKTHDSVKITSDRDLLDL